MIELIAARGNTSLESAVALTKELRIDIQNLGQRFANAAASSEEYRTGSSRNRAALKVENENELALIVYDVKKLLTRIEDAVPLISLALTTSGAKLSTTLPPTVSPSRLLQASNLITAGDAQYTTSPHCVAQIGPTFVLSVYMLFAGHDRPETEEDIRQTTWKEVIHKAHITLRRVPLEVLSSTGSGSEALQLHEISSTRKTPTQLDTSAQVRAESRSDEFAYQMMIVEDFDDDRHHSFEDGELRPSPFDHVRLAGIREMMPIHEISKIFYADTSKVLNIGSDAESNHPVLLLRRDVHAVPPRRMVEREHSETPGNVGDAVHDDDGKPQTQEDKDYVEQDHSERKQDPWRLPPSLDPEWIALEVYTEAEVSDSEVDPEEDTQDQAFATPLEGPDSPQLSISLASLNINSPMTNTESNAIHTQERSQQFRLPPIKTSLSMLELLLRLTSLQQFQQQSHLSIPDELLNFFLEESASTGAGGDEHHRQAIRADARRRVGWDPYDESPLKRRGEEYLYNHQPHHDSPQGSRSQYSYNSSNVGSPAPSGTVFSPNGLQTQSRSITGTPESKSRASPSMTISNHSKITTSKRPEWLRRPDEGHTGSPLRSTIHSDEGIGTSPANIDENKS